MNRSLPRSSPIAFMWRAHVIRGFRRRAGLTIVELLVVVGIMLAFAAVVVPSLGTSIESRRGREAVRMLTTFMSKAQARALGGREWAGFTIDTMAGSAYAAVDLSLADVPPVYRGDTVPAILQLTGSTNQGTRTAVGMNGELANVGTSGVRGGDLIRFDGRGPFYEVDSGNALGPAVTGTSIRFEFRGFDAAQNYDASNPDDALNEQSGYLLHNTPWPSTTSTGLPFEILRQPVRSGSPFTLPDARVIDLQYSGYGPPVTGAFRTFADVVGAGTRVGSVAVLFDGTGRLRQLIVAGGAAASPWRLAVTGPVLLLVGRADRIGQGFSAAAGGDDDGVGANWQYADSFWIAIDPFTGVVRSAQCADVNEDTNSNGALDPGEDANGNGALDVRAVDPVSSQRWIRQILITGGR